MRVRARRIWILEVNAARARILRSLDATPAAPAPILLEGAAHKLRDIMADQPGRSFSSSGDGRRFAVEGTGDALAEERRRFLRAVADRLEADLRAEAFDDLVVVAGDAMLGDLRRALPEALRARVVAELPANLGHLADHDLARRVAGHLAGGGGA